jgi:hypothetical protein
VDLIERAAATPESQRDLAALAGELGDADAGALLREACAHHLDRAFTSLLFATLHAGRTVPADLLVDGARLLPSVDALAAVVLRLEGDVGAALVGAVKRRGLDDREPGALLVAELWARRSGSPRPAGLLAEARIRARRQQTVDGEDALIALSGLLEDPDLAALVDEFSSPEARESARLLTSRLVDHLLGPVLGPFPARPQKRSTAKGSVRRAVAKVGRNDPCPCGSGKKYKLCHEAEDRARLAESSDVEGLTLTELQKDLERHLTAERLRGLRGHELARLDPLRVPVELRSDWIQLLCGLGEIEAAGAAIRAWLPADGPLDEVLDDLLRLVAEHAARAGRVPLTRELVARRGSEDLLLLEARLALRDDPLDRMRLLEQAARESLDARGVDLGFALTSAGWPALGVHVARSELVLRPRDEHADALYATLLETRDELLAPPWDPVEDVLYLLDHGVAPEVDRELAEARSVLDRNESALRTTQEALDAVKAELDRREAEARRAAAQVPAEEVVKGPVAAPIVDDSVVRELRSRVEQLKSELKDRHRERNALRRELEEAREQMAELQAHEDEEEADAPETEDDDEVEMDATVAARIRVPVLPHGFSARLREVPDATARAALVKLGELCAGFDVAFREVRPLRGFEGTWRAKVGRSYRLLFRPHEDTLEVIELLHRQDLEKRLFRLRRAGEG